MSFIYVLIPALNEENLQEYSGNINGGLENDEVQLTTKNHLKIDFVNICSLCLPTLQTNYIGISLYSHCEGKELNLPYNSRATDIVKACGHITTEIYGDAFLSRYYDNENEEWKRVDLRIEEASISSQWVHEVAQMNAGKNMSSYTTSGITNQTLQNLLGSGSGSSNSNINSRNSVEEVKNDGPIQWTQTNDDIEIQIEIPSQTKSKDVKVKFTSTTLSVNVINLNYNEEVLFGKILLPQGARLFRTIQPDDSTWTLSREGDKLFLHITLNKSSSINWTSLLIE
mmetsp:Transcript_2135/g.2093  ORF Transcript_2135/g.2093 Transcript_2135/m.2093 type:complete len:284 (+) Transcript_2135:29-880(+)